MQVKTLLKNYKGPFEVHFVKKPWYKIVPKNEIHRHYEDEILEIKHTKKCLIIYSECAEYELEEEEDVLPWY